MKETLSVKMSRCVVALLVMAGLAGLPSLAKAQTLTESGDYSVVSTLPMPLDLTYARPPQGTKLRNYFFDAFGPYPIVGSAVIAGIDQADASPPEWKLGAEGYGRRFASNYGIAAVSTTTRYALAEALKEDTLYYRCECTGVFPRFKHAVIATLTARRGEDGHRVFSIPSLLAPYVGAMTAVHGWYPSRYDAEDGFRMGSYSLLESMGQNLALEFLYSGPHSLLTRMHLNNRHGALNQGTTP